MTSACDIHNKLAEDFVTKVASKTSSHSELMVVIESSILATLLISQKIYGISAAVNVEMVEMAIQEATNRFAAAQNGK